MIDGGGIRIRSNGQTPLDMPEAPVIVLGGGKDSPQRITQGIKQNDVGGGDGRHGKVECVRKRRVGVGKGLTAG